VSTLTEPGLRPLMFAVAYRMLGSVAEAEDVVQDAFLRMHEAAPTDVASPRAYALTVTTRLAIDELRSARRRRERYVGTWLPEPLLTAGSSADPESSAELRESVSMAFLVLLERLSPVERAVFVLREAFSCGYDEIATTVGKSATNCRQILARARARVGDPQPRFAVDARRRAELAERFFTATATGDLAGLERLLAADVAFHGDGGGQAQAVREPVIGRTRVARFLLGIARQSVAHGMSVRQVEVNGEPGGQFVDADGRTVAVVALEIDGEQIVAVRNVVNPDKLAHLC
jgi:RNA polymerase sigma-70 factor (ECF subfamily)